MMKKKLLLPLLLLLSLGIKAQQKVIPLYPGVAPGSENWTWTETEDSDNMYHAHTIYNISKPTLTVYLPDSVYNTTGTAIIVCPGGGFQSLSIMQEGYAVVKWLQKKGITAFLLKYRLMHTIGHDPYKQQIDSGNSKTTATERQIVVPMAIADGRQAITYVREHAAEYGISPSRIGILGFSAGGVISAATAYDYTPADRPDFVGFIYGGGLPPDMQTNVPADAPPVFIAAATNDTYGLETEAVSLYNNWIHSKHSAELHIYSEGSHGFGMNIQHMESDTWSDNFIDWMNDLGFIAPAYPKKGKISQKQAAEYAKINDERMRNDWAYFKHYDADNAKLEAMPPDPKRVVFMGNSITENWGNMDTAFFKDNDYISRGISGQTSSQMLVRFREDVIDLKPAAVVISAGTNDLAQNTGYIAPENIYGNIVSMAELAKASGIEPVLTSVLPATDFPWRRGLDPAEKIVRLNQMIKDYAMKNHLVYVDYWSAMVNDKDGLRPDLTLDGFVHPNMAGYKVMEPLVKKGINTALNRK